MVDTVMQVVRWVARRLPYASEPLLVAGIGCVAVALIGRGMSLGGISIAGLDSWRQQLVVLAAGVVVLALSLVVGQPSADGTGAGPPPVAVRARGFLGPRPRRPARFVPRPELVAELVGALVDRSDRPVALVGMGGAGKTVLAAVAAGHPRVRRRYVDGVVWVDVNREPDVAALLSRLVPLLGGPRSGAISTYELRDILAGLLGGRQVLLVLDDVWDRRVLDAFAGLSARVLFTSRYRSLAHDLDAHQVEVARLSLAQSLALLGRWTGRTVDEMPPVADRLCLGVDNLALGVAMVGAMLSRPGRSWQDVLDLLEAVDLDRIRADFGDDYPHPTLLAAIQLSIDDLPDNAARRRYRELAVFAGQGAFPRAAVEVLWGSSGETAPLDGPAVGELLDLLMGRSLLTAEADDGWYGLHDLQHQVTAAQLGSDGLRAAHGRLVDGYRARNPTRWADAPDDGYLRSHLAQHLAASGANDELVGLLSDPWWMVGKLGGGIADLLADYAHGADRTACEAIQSALHLSADMIVDDPTQLPGQLVGRLVGHPDPAVRAAVEAIRAWDGAPWLCPLGPGGLASAHGPQRRILRAGVGAIGVAISPDSKMVATGSGHDVMVWDVASSRVVRKLEGRLPSVSCVAISPDGELVVAGADDGEVRVWNLASGRLVRSFPGRGNFPGHKGKVNNLSISADSELLAVVYGYEDRPPPSRWTRPVRRLSGYRLGGGDRRRLLTSQSNDVLRLWHLPTGQMERASACDPGTLNAVTFAPDGSTVLTTGERGALQVWDVASGRRHKLVSDPGAIVTSLAISPDGHTVVAGGDRSVRLWDVVEDRKIAELTTHAEVTTVAVSPDGQLIAAGTAARTVHLWDMATRQPVAGLAGHTDRVTGVAMSPDGRYVASSGDISVRIWDHTEAAAPDGTTLAAGALRAAALSADGGIAVGVHHDGAALRLRSFGAEPIRLAGNESLALAVAVGPRGRRVVVGQMDGGVRVWDTKLERFTAERQVHRDSVEAVAVSANGRIATASHDQTARVWDLGTDRLITLRGHTDRLLSVAISQDGGTVVTSAWDGTVRVWDGDTGRAGPTFRRPRGPRHRPGDVLVTANGQLVVMSWPGNVFVCDSRTGEQVQILHRFGNALAATSDGGTLVLAGSSGLEVWSLVDGRRVARWSCDHLVLATVVVDEDPLTFQVVDASGATYALQLQTGKGTAVLAES